VYPDTAEPTVEEMLDDDKVNAGAASAGFTVSANVCVTEFAALIAVIA
jgi:hypothetical protein